MLTVPWATLITIQHHLINTNFPTTNPDKKRVGTLACILNIINKIIINSI